MTRRARKPRNRQQDGWDDYLADLKRQRMGDPSQHKPHFVVEIEQRRTSRNGKRRLTLGEKFGEPFKFDRRRMIELLCHGHSQAQVSRTLGVTPQAISQALRDMGLNVQKLRRALEVSPPPHALEPGEYEVYPVDRFREDLIGADDVGRVRVIRPKPRRK